MGFFEDAHGWGGGGGKKALSHISDHDETWHSYTLAKEDLKIYMYHMIQPLSSADSSIFSPEISKFCYIKKYRYRLYSDTKFLKSL